MSAEVQTFAPAVDTLGQRVIDRIGIPKDAWEIAAQLEVEGMRDSDARSQYGVRDLFELARAIERRFRSGVYSFVVEGEDPRPRVIPALRLAKHYFAGIVFAAPMALQAASMLLWGYGIWGAIDLHLIQGSAVALGFIASYVVAGGFVQAIVRRGFFYVYQQETQLARWTALRGFSIAVRTMLLLLIPAAVLNLLFHILPWSMVLVAFAYYAGLGVLWLSWALIYLVRKTVLLLVITAAALGVVLVAAKVFHASPLIANAAGVIFADALSFAIALFFINRLAQKGVDSSASDRRRDHERYAAKPVNPPRVAVLAISTSRYFVYGLLFNAFLFADRVIAWTTSVGREDFPPYAFWLNVRYELALDLALVVAIVMSGVVEYATVRFSEKLVPHEKRTKSDRAETFADAQLDAHRSRSFQLAAMALVAVAAACGVFYALEQMPNARLHEAVTAAVTLRVFVAAAVGYVFFMFGVRNLLLLLTLSRVNEAVRSIAIAITCDVVLGFICSRALGYWAAVAGFVAGAIVLAFASGRAARGVLEKLDYFYYSAY